VTRFPRPALHTVFGIIIATGTASCLAAQEPADPEKSGPYSELRFRLSGARVVNRERIHDFWRSQTGAGAGISTPFYVGSIGLGATLIPFEARDTQRPNFRALILAIDWGAAIPIPGPVRLRASARVGDFVMLIENPELWLDSESELLVGGELAAGLPVRRNLAVTVAGSFTHVRTRPSLDVALLTLGLEYATRTPGWLRAFLE
jgi:hypothetical protein